MRGSKLLVMSQERDLRVIVYSFLGILDIWDILAKRPTKHILRKKPGQEIPSNSSAVSDLHINTLVHLHTLQCVQIGLLKRKHQSKNMFKEGISKMITGSPTDL